MTIEEIKLIAELREKLINKSREELLGLAQDYQEALINELVTKWLPLLTSSPDKKKNYLLLAKIDDIVEKIKLEQGGALVTWFIERMGKIADLAKKQLSATDAVNSALESLLYRFGYDGQALIQGGFLFDLIQIADPIRKIKAMAFQGIFRGVGFEQFKEMLGVLIGGGKHPGAIEGYYRTAAYDSFQQSDRFIQNKTAQNLGLTHAMYSGGAMETSRDFCLERVWRFFTLEEILAWEKLEWDGKNSPYDVLTDLGGYNCIHVLSWVSRRMYDQNASEHGLREIEPK